MALNARRSIGWLVAVSGFAFIAAMTLTPQPGPSSYSPSLCILCGDSPLQDIVLNILLFVPYGLGLRLSGLDRHRAVIIAACTSITIELLQMHIIPGRDSSLGDVLTNTLGGATGVYFADAWRRWILPSPQRARALLWASATLWIAVVAATVWGLRRTLPNTTLWGRWRPDLMHMDPFPGRVLTADAAGYPFPPGASGTDTTFRARLTSDSILVQATVLPDSPTLRLAPILDLSDSRRIELFVLGQRGRAVEFSMRMNATRSGMHGPVIALKNVFPAAAAPHDAPDTLRVAGGIVRGSLVIRATDGHGAYREGRVALSPGLGWSFFVPWGYALGSDAPLLSMLWLGGLLVPVGFWAARSERSVEAWAVACAGVLLGLLVSPRLVHGANATTFDWAGSAIGFAAGWMLGRLGRTARAVSGRVPP